MYDVSVWTNEHGAQGCERVNVCVYWSQPTAYVCSVLCICVIFSMRLFAVYWIVLNGMSLCVCVCVLIVDENKNECNQFNACATFSFSAIICEMLNSFFAEYWSDKLYSGVSCAQHNNTRWNWIFVGIVIVFMTVVFTWCQQIFVCIVSAVQCFGFSTMFALTQQFFLCLSFAQQTEIYANVLRSIDFIL